MKAKIDKFLHSNYLLLIVGVLIFTCWCLELVTLAHIIVCVAACLVLIFCVDLTPLAFLMCVFPCLITEKFISSTSFIFWLLPFGIILAGCLIYYIVKNWIIPKKKLTPGKLWIGFVLAFIAKFLAGAFSPDFTFLRMFSSVGLITYTYFIYFILINATNGKLKDYVYKILVFICLLAIAEMAVYYIRLPREDLLIKILKKHMNIGWLMTNSAATIFTITMPFCLYQACKSKYAWVHYSIFSLLCFALVITLSRTGLLFAGLIIPIAVLYAFIKTPYKKQMFIVFAVSLIISIILYFALKDFINECIKILTIRGSSLNGRQEIWDYCFGEFKKYPAFGIGDYGEDHSNLGHKLRLIHNTPLQILCCTGVIGAILFLPYFYQRYKLLLTKFSLYKCFAFIAVLIWELGGLFDINFIRVLQQVLIYTIIASCEIETDKEPAWLTRKKKSFNISQRNNNV